jgi:competence protein ComGC
MSLKKNLGGVNYDNYVKLLLVVLLLLLLWVPSSYKQEAGVDMTTFDDNNNIQNI